MTFEVFPWDTNFETGIDIIDQQHQKLVKLINKLAVQLAHGADQKLLNEVLDELSDYTVYHFTTEEAIWRKHLPGEEMTAEHEVTHQNFIDEVVKVKQACHTLCDDNVSKKVLSFLTHWLAFHILDTDRRMAAIIQSMERGLSLQEAKDDASKTMSGAMQALIETVLKMYDSLSTQTLEFMREVAKRQRVEQNLLLSKSVIESTFEAIFVTNADGVLIDANPSFCSYVNSEYDHIIGVQFQDIKAELFGRQLVSDIWMATREKGHWSGEVSGLGVDGVREAAWLTLSVIRDEKGDVANYAGVLSSVSQLIERQYHLEVEANHDNLTGLPNRRLLSDRLNQAILHHERNNKQLAVCFLDLDGFKEVNDTLGHDAGDQVLRMIAQRLERVVRGEDTVARIGGDEFVLLFGDLTDLVCLPPLLQKVLESIQLPISVHGEQACVSASIGVSIFPDHAEGAESLLKQADKLMYQAKQTGKSKFYIQTT